MAALPHAVLYAVYVHKILLCADEIQPAFVARFSQICQIRQPVLRSAKHRLKSKVFAAATQVLPDGFGAICRFEISSFWCHFVNNENRNPIRVDKDGKLIRKREFVETSFAGAIRVGYDGDLRPERLLLFRRGNGGDRLFVLHLLGAVRTKIVLRTDTETDRVPKLRLLPPQ